MALISKLWVTAQTTPGPIYGLVWVRSRVEWGQGVCTPLPGWGFAPGGPASTGGAGTRIWGPGKPRFCPGARLHRTAFWGEDPEPACTGMGLLRDMGRARRRSRPRWPRPWPAGTAVLEFALQHRYSFGIWNVAAVPSSWGKIRDFYYL